MDSSNNFLTKFKNFILTLDQDFLIDSANKGLYKRAIKELDAGLELELEIEADKANAKFPDGINCSVSADITDFNCSCPSAKICKHVLISLLWTQRNKENIFSSEETEVNESEEIELLKDFSWILNIKLDELKKYLTEKEFKEIIFRIAFGIEVSFEEQAFLLADFKDSGTKVRFTEEADLKKTLCNCKKKDFCQHRAEAVLLYQLREKQIELKDLYSILEKKVPAEDTSVLKKLLKDILILGLAKLPGDILNRVESCAIISHSLGLALIEKQFRSLKTNLELYFKRHASFSESATKDLISKIYNSLTVIENSSDQALIQELIGEYKSSYFKIPPLELLGMGASYWRTASGYAGITAYFFNPLRKNWFTYSVSRPEFYQDYNPSLRKDLIGTVCPWLSDYSLTQISKKIIKLNQGKINKDNRISSSAETKGTVLGDVDFTQVDFGDQLFSDWEKLKTKLTRNFSYQLKVKRENDNLVLIKPADWGTSEFDQVNQELILPLYDDEEREILIKLKFNQENEFLIKQLEGLAKAKKRPDYLLGKVYFSDGKMIFIPLTCGSKKQIFNLNLEEI